MKTLREYLIENSNSSLRENSSQKNQKNLNNAFLEAVNMCDIDEMKRCLDAGADINCHDKAKETPLHVACMQSNPQPAMILIDAGASLNFQNKNGDTPLHIALNYENSEIAEKLIEAGADVNLQNKQMQTPLHLAYEFCESAIIKMLIKAGANVNAKNKYGQTPFHTAAQTHSDYFFNLAQILIDNGADPNIPDNRGKLPVDLAFDPKVRDWFRSKT